MGEARRRKLVGNTDPNKQWHGRKAGDRHVKKVSREMLAAVQANPIGTALALQFAASRGRR